MRGRRAQDAERRFGVHERGLVAAFGATQVGAAAQHEPVLDRVRVLGQPAGGLLETRVRGLDLPFGAQAVGDLAVQACRDGGLQLDLGPETAQGGLVVLLGRSEGLGSVMEVADFLERGSRRCRRTAFGLPWIVAIPIQHGLPLARRRRGDQNLSSNRQRMSRSSCNLVHSDCIQLSRGATGASATLAPTGSGDRGRASRLGMSSSPFVASGSRSPGPWGNPTLRPTLAALWNCESSVARSGG